MRFSNEVNCAWLTLNRSCNLRCEWCYAQSTGYSLNDDMSLDLAKKIIDMLADLKVTLIALIGGEPTLHKDLFKIIEYAKLKGMRVNLITNGLLFSDEKFAKKIKDIGDVGVNLSIKGGTKQEYIDLTKVDCFDSVTQAIMNLVKYQISFEISYVITNENVFNIIKTLKFAKMLGAKSFYLEFCNPIIEENKINNYQINPVDLVNNFSKIVIELENEIDNYIIHQNFPECIWDKDILELLNSKGRLTSICQLNKKSGLIFDTHGNLLICNALMHIPIGYYEKDYSNAEELKRYFNSSKVESYYKLALRSPSKKCDYCDDFKTCGSGCALRWFNYSFDSLIEIFKQNKKGGAIK